MPHRIAVTERSSTSGRTAANASGIVHPDCTISGSGRPARRSASAQPSARCDLRSASVPNAVGIARWWTVWWPRSSRYRVASAAIWPSSSPISHGSSLPVYSPMATSACGWASSSVRRARMPASSWATMMVGSPALGSRAMMLASEWVSSGSSTEIETLQPAARAAFSMPRRDASEP